MKVPEAQLYRTQVLCDSHCILNLPSCIVKQDFRRGHANDLQLSGAPISVILEAGEWRSAACPEQCYMDRIALEASTVMDAHFAASDDSESD